MKLYYPIAFLFFIVFWGACKKENEKPDQEFTGELTLYVNGTPYLWVSNVSSNKRLIERCFPDTCIAINFDYFKDFENYHITINNVPLRTGFFLLKSSPPVLRDSTLYRTNLYVSETDGEPVNGIIEDLLLLDVYQLPTIDSANYLHITELNKKTGAIKGAFHATFVRDTMWKPSGIFPDTVRISDGLFSTRINWHY